MVDRSRLITEPILGSTYPISLVPRGEDPSNPSIRIIGGAMAAFMLALYMVIVPLVNTAVVAVGYLADGQAAGWNAFATQANAFETPWGILASHLGLASMLLVVWALFHFVHHRRLGWLWSVMPGVRWRYGLIALFLALLVFAGLVIWQVSQGLSLRPPSSLAWYVVVVVLTTPLQVLAEEVMFRGYLMQTLGSVVRSDWFAIVGTALVFALFHGTQDPWLFTSRLAFGLLAGCLVRLTGGLEAGVAIHLINNYAAFGLALASGTLSQIRTTTAISWQQSLRDVGLFAVAGMLCWLLGRQMRLPQRVAI
ncbi:MAG: CPBP family intramembrane metalloprotease [Propionibacteriaceae bacterium]|jgi:membrane protease YdiL (CAAX protease family)|nr:CPBP family intramembrane metalloprotease [Propionibacteriaceae bacterium]